MLAGDVTAILGARVNPAGFVAYDAALGRATASATKAEAAQVKHTAAMTTGASAAGRFGSVARTGAAAGAVVLAAAMAKSVAVAADFESQMDRVKAVTQASGRDMKAMTAIARDLGKKTGLGATEAARGLEALAKGGLTTKQIIGGGLAGALALAQAGQMDVAQAAETTANALNLFGLSGSQATHVADAMATAANATTADVSDFAMALTQAGAAAKVSGLSFDETIVALESLAKIGVKGSDAGTSLKAALLQTINPTKEAAAAMRRYGIDFTDAQGKMKPLGTVAEMLQSKLGGLTKEQKIAALQAMAGTDGFRALAALMEQGGEGVDRLSGGLKKSGEAARVARENTDNLNGAWDKFKAQLQDIAIVAGTPLLEGLTDGLEKITGWLDGLGDSQGFQDFAADLQNIGGHIADFLDTINAGTAVGDYLKGVAGNFALITDAVSKLMDGDFSGMFDSIKQLGANMAKTIVAPFRAIGSGIVGPVAGAVSQVLGLLGGLMSGVASTFGALAKVPGPLQGMFKAAAAAARGAADNIAGVRRELEQVGKPKKIPFDVQVGQAVAALQQIRGTKIEPKVMRILGSDQDAKSKTKALIALGIPPKTAKLLANIADVLGKVPRAQDAIDSLRGKTIPVNVSGNAFSQIADIGAQLAGIRSKTVTVNVRTTGPRRELNASGRGPGKESLALVGEGRNPREAVVSPSGGWSMVTSGPTLMGLPADAYVIPEDPAYRGRALGFLGMLADDLGLRGFKDGKKPKKRASAQIGTSGANGKATPLGLPVPGALSPTTLPLDQAEEKERKARESLNDAKQKVHDLPGKISDKRKQIKDISGRNAKSPETKAKKARDLKKAKDELAELQGSLSANRKAQSQRRAEWAEARKLLSDAKRWQAEIKRQETIANTAASRMANANRAGDRGAYDAAKRDRLAALDRLRSMLQAAKDAFKGQANLDVSGQFEQTVGELQQATDEAFEISPDEALSDPEKARLAELDRDVALAALTAKTGDDVERATDRKNFLEGLLSTAQSQNRSAPVITELAELVQSARENVRSFSSSGASNENADLQAQIDQQRARADLAEQNARLNAQALATFSDPNDIGTGWGGVNLTVNTLHPGDPRTLTAIGQAAAAGFGFQGGISSPRTAVG